jgi:tRNA dimethylallyltransferase
VRWEAEGRGRPEGSAVARVVAVVGPTATGKSDVAIELASALDGEVVNADALQLYRGMDVGTAKVPPPARKGVPHHLLDVLDVRQDAALAAYQRDARAAVADIAARGRVPVLVGGSGLYLRAVLDPFEIPPTDPVVRARLEEELATHGPAALHRRLRELDPVAAAAILASNGRRVVRALEVVQITGRPFSASLPAHDAPGGLSARLIGLRADRAELDARIEARVRRMWRDGLVAETERLIEAGLREGRTARQALGYAQVLRLLDGGYAGEADPAAAAQADIVRGTRRFARRQESWFRRDRRIHWLPAGTPDLVARALRALRSPAAGP